MLTENQKGSIHTTIENKIATLEFGHPSSNSFPSDLLIRLTTELNTLDKNSSVSVIILKSSGSGAFCAGASFEELLAVSNQKEATKLFSGFANVLNAMRNCSKIIVGRIHGKAVGGGVGIIAACDYALATSQSAIKLSELAIGIGPFVIEPVVSRKIGKSAMAVMTLEIDWKSANWVFDTTTELDDAILAFANKLANYNPEALTEMKKVIWEGTENWNTLLYESAEISGKLLLSEFSINALHQLRK
jgi:methylglutaconyl-CoA hydratase